jgi:hypothetical protein
MSKRKEKSSKAAAPTAHDKLSSDFLAALQAKWESQGPQLLDKMAETDPVKVCELVAKLVPIRPPPPVNGKNAPDTTEAIARQALEDVGMNPQDIEDADVRLAKEAYEQLLDKLERIKDLRVLVHDGGKPPGE